MKMAKFRGNKRFRRLANIQEKKAVVIVNVIRSCLSKFEPRWPSISIYLVILVRLQAAPWLFLRELRNFSKLQLLIVINCKTEQHQL